jgi:hypothetical protein
MKDTFEFTLNNPLTEEQWDMITDVDFDRTDRITFYTKHGKEVEFVKVIRCKDCIHHHGYICDRLYGFQDAFTLQDDDYCSRAEQKGKQ